MKDIIYAFLIVILLAIVFLGIVVATKFCSDQYADWRAERTSKIEKWADNRSINKCRMERLFHECLKAKPDAPKECADVALRLSQARRETIDARCL